jgi:hypothetical protein
MFIEIITNPAFPIVTLLIGILIGHRLTLGRDKRQEFNKVATSFREAFLPELTYLEHNANTGDLGGSNDLCEILSAGYVHRHLNAYQVFREYLSHRERVKFEKAWRKYCYHQENPSTQFFEQYSWKIQGTGKDKENYYNQLALDRILDLLKFSKNK